MDKQNRDTFTWKQCHDAFERYPPIGTDAVAVKDGYMSFPEFIEYAYAKAILTDTAGYDLFKSKIDPCPVVQLPPPTGPAPSKKALELQAVRDGIKSAELLQQQATSGSVDMVSMSSSGRQLSGLFGEETPPVGANVVYNDGGLEHGVFSLECWKSRALAAEMKVDTLEDNLVKKDDEVTELKRKLAQCGNAKESFNASADLAAINFREFRSACSAPIIEGLKSQFSSIPKTLEAIKNISAQLTGFRGSSYSGQRFVHQA